MDFDTAFDLLIDTEKGLSMDPSDPGNWVTVGGKRVLKGTKYGISAAAYPTLDIANITLEQAKAIYIKDYWIEGIPDSIAFDLFDTSVNSGKHTAIKLLQRTVGVIDDGSLGPNTLAACVHTTNISARFNANRLLYMTSCNGWQSQGKGWARRVALNILLSNK